jgi:HSP20 family protein
MVNIVKRSPRFGDVARFDPFTSMEDWFKGFGLRPLFNEMDAAPLIKIDLAENDKTYTIHAEIPGVNKEDIKVQVDGNRVSISAETKKEKKEKEEKEGERVICRERYQGSSYRSFTLDSDVDEASTSAKYENGVLELILPKKNGKKLKQIEIK